MGAYYMPGTVLRALFGICVLIFATILWEEEPLLTPLTEDKRET